MKDDLVLPENPSIQDYQAYIAKMVKLRGFDKNTIAEEMLLFAEEFGELAKVVRKASGMRTDVTAIHSSAEDELADVFNYLLNIANLLGVDLEVAFRKKEEKNKLRNWS
jgi:NTP pyrophosphatase (non-canonical NTP hydrolase)